MAATSSHEVKVTASKQQNLLTRLCQICSFSSTWLSWQWNPTIIPENKYHQGRDRLFSDSILSWVIAKINANCKNILTFSFIEEFRGSSWNETLVHRFQEKFRKHQPSILIMFLNVGRYSENIGNSMRQMNFIWEYYDREQKRYKDCHYSLIAYSFKNSKCFYCDSLGCSKPIFIDSYIQELILFFKNESVLTDIIECHSNDTNIRSCQVQKHKCTQGRCALYFPLQCCGNICGASAIMCECLAAYDYELFERLCTFQRIRQSADLSSIKCLKNIYYGTFLRVVLMQWFIEDNIDISDIAGEKCKEQSTHTEPRKSTPTERGEKGNSSSLRCKRVLSPSSNKRSNK